MLNRRRFVAGGLASVGLVSIAGACNTSSNDDSTSDETTPSDGSATDDTEDFEARFADFEVADEPNGDLSKVVWPAFVTEAGPEVKQLYEFQVTHGELMRYMPCFCGCGENDGHRSNRDCYVESVEADGSVVFDSMAPT